MRNQTVDIQQNTLYLLTPGSYVSRDRLTLYVEVPVYPAELAPAERTRENAADWKKVTSADLDPFVGFLHVDRPNRPSLAQDLMEEFRPWLADRLAVTLINRQQIGAEHFHERVGGAVELTEPGRKLIIKTYQERKQERLNHPLLDQHLRVSQLPFVQARILARHLRGDLAGYLPLVPK